MVHFTLQSNALNHAFQSVNFTIEEFNRGSLRLDAYLQRLAEQLNSNQHFEADDTFTMESTFIRLPGRGSERTRIGFRALDKLLPGDVWVELPKPHLVFADYEAALTHKVYSQPSLSVPNPKTRTRHIPSTVPIVRQTSSTIWIP